MIKFRVKANGATIAIVEAETELAAREDVLREALKGRPMPRGPMYDYALQALEATAIDGESPEEAWIALCKKHGIDGALAPSFVFAKGVVDLTMEVYPKEFDETRKLFVAALMPLLMRHLEMTMSPTQEILDMDDILAMVRTNAQ